MKEGKKKGYVERNLKEVRGWKKEKKVE